MRSFASEETFKLDLEGCLRDQKEKENPVGKWTKEFNRYFTEVET